MTVRLTMSSDYVSFPFDLSSSIKGEQSITYSGDRTVQDIIQFAERASG